MELAGREVLTLTEILVDRPFVGARLVVLSACQTAVAGVDTTPDEVVGLATGFLRAGSAGVIGTLWRVDDLASALLMRRFYAYHINGDPETGERPMHAARALRLAQRDLARLSIDEVNDFLEVQAAETDTSGVAGRLRTPTQDLGSALDLERPFAHPRHWAAFVFIGA